MALTEAPARLTIIDVDRDPVEDLVGLGQIEVLFNPESFSRQITVAYKEHQILGGSFAPQEYLRTDNQIIDITVQYLTDSLEAYLDLERAAKFIESFAYPSQVDSYLSNAPSTMLIIWPNTMSLRCKLHTVKFTHNLFASTGQTVGMSIAMKLKEVSVRRITKSSVRRFGAFRSGEGASEQG